MIEGLGTRMVSKVEVEQRKLLHNVELWCDVTK